MELRLKGEKLACVIRQLAMRYEPHLVKLRGKCVLAILGNEGEIITNRQEGRSAGSWLAV
jgi:hypothetical protein